TRPASPRTLWNWRARRSAISIPLPIMSCVFFLAGPLMMIATYFEAIGDAGKAALLSLVKPYAFAIPLTFLLPIGLGEIGIWYAGPLAEVMLLGLTGLVLRRAARRSPLRWGIFHIKDGAWT
ncbi:MAG: hypothetical protein AAGA78_10545, partial [Pseudomonadota bacterium]